MAGVGEAFKGKIEEVGLGWIGLVTFGSSFISILEYFRCILVDLMGIFSVHGRFVHRRLLQSLRCFG